MIGEEKHMNIESLDFYSIFLKEGEDFYQCLRKFDKDEFNYWVARYIVKVGEIRSFEDVKPDFSIIALSEQAGYKHIDSGCHYSAKAICILLPEFEYFTGFIWRNESINPIITHSFNVTQNRIVDFSRYITDPLNMPISQTFPHEYFGINIPREFVLKFREETINLYSMSPLICEWYVAQN